MNYFELFDLPVRIALDKEQLQRQYFRLSRKYHPDYYIQATAEEQAEALERSSALHQALQILQDPEARIKHVLELKGVWNEEEKYALEPDFLMDVMDINEALMELEMEPNTSTAESISQQTNTILDASYQIVAPYLEDPTGDLLTPEALLQVKEYYYRKKYLQRILDKLAFLKESR